MSDHYYQQPPYASAFGGDAAHYAPPDSVYQNPPYDYDPHQQPYKYNQYGSQYDLSQTPRSYPPPEASPPSMLQPTEYLSPVSAECPPPDLHRHGSNADY